ncbi:MAG: hypothetical protein Q9191_007779, partial [Dirinaria sp. TL-2023a]
ALLKGKSAKAKGHAEARQLPEASRDFLIYQRQQQTENDPSQKIKKRVERAIKNIEALHLKSDRVAVQNDN